MWRRKSFWMPTVQGLFDQVGISPSRPMSFFMMVARRIPTRCGPRSQTLLKLRRTPRTAGSGLRKLRQAEILRFVYWASRDLLPHKVPRKP